MDNIYTMSFNLHKYHWLPGIVPGARVYQTLCGHTLNDLKSTLDFVMCTLL